MIDAARAKWVKVRLAIAENLTQRKLLRAEESKAHGDFLVATGGDTLQRELELSDDHQKIEQLQGTSPETSALIAKRRRETIEAGAIRVLKAAGGEMSNKDLASLLNQDSHGLSGLLSQCDSIEKTRMGRQRNEIVAWKLKETK